MDNDREDQINENSEDQMDSSSEDQINKDSEDQMDRDSEGEIDRDSDDQMGSNSEYQTDSDSEYQSDTDSESLSEVYQPFPSTLQEIAAFKIYTTLLDHCASNFKPESSVLTEHKEDELNCGHDCEIRWNREWSELRKIIRCNVEKLTLPKIIKEELLEISYSIWDELQYWIIFLFTFESPYIEFPWQQKIVWEKQKKINWLASAEMIQNLEKREEACLRFLCCRRMKNTIVDRMKDPEFRFIICSSTAPAHDLIRGLRGLCDSLPELCK